MITFDPFYSVPEYLDIIDAMRYNDVDFHEYIDMRTKLWYVSIDSTPTHKYSSIDEKRYLVEKTRSIDPLKERSLDRQIGSNDISRYITTDCIEQLKKVGAYACYAYLVTANEALQLSREVNGNIWWFGTYFNDVGIGVSLMMPARCRKCIMTPLDIGTFDLEINRQLLNYKTYLRKYTTQPYFRNGKFYTVKGKRVYDY